MRPNFIVIGAMKCASSTVCDYLERHPDAFMVASAEPEFFSHDENFAKGVEWYERFFEGAGGAVAIGEGSNAYAAAARFPDSAARMAAYAPDLKVIYMVRDPVARIVSHWIQNRENFGVKAPSTLDLAVTERREFYLDPSLYWKNLERYRAHFPDERIFVGFMEDLQAEPTAFYARLNDFLGLRDAPLGPPAHRNPSLGKTVPSPALDALAGLGLVQRLKRVAPAGLKARVRRALSTTLDARPEFSAPVREGLVAEVGPDAARLLAHCGKPADFWPTTAHPPPRRPHPGADVDARVNDPI